MYTCISSGVSEQIPCRGGLPEHLTPETIRRFAQIARIEREPHPSHTMNIAFLYSDCHHATGRLGPDIPSQYPAEPLPRPNTNQIAIVPTIHFDKVKRPEATAVQNNPLIHHSTSIGEGGRYSTSSVPVGEVLATIDTLSIQFGNAAAHISIPERSCDAQTSNLKANVKPGKNETVDFSLVE